MKPIPFITCDEGGYLEVSPSARDYLRDIKHHQIYVVSVAGLYRTGKSYLLNLLLERLAMTGVDVKTDKFGVGGSIHAHTKGIWIYGSTFAAKQEGVPEKTIILLDSEGLGSMDRTQTEDIRIFALSLLLSSTFVYNSRGAIDSKSLEDLSLVLNLSKNIHVVSHRDINRAVDKSLQPSSPEVNEVADELARFFPSFIWVIRDFTLQLEEDGKELSSTEYLERALQHQSGNHNEVSRSNDVRSVLSTCFVNRDCVTMVRPVNDENLLRKLDSVPFEDLRSEFREQVDHLVQKLHHTMSYKQVMGRRVNGPILLSLAESYTSAFNNGLTPAIDSAWTRVLNDMYDEVLFKATELFRRNLQSGMSPDDGADLLSKKPLESDEARAVYDFSRSLGLTCLMKPDLIREDTFMQYQEKYFDLVHSVWEVMGEQNYQASCLFSNKLLSEICSDVVKGDVESGHFLEKIWDFTLVYFEDAKGPAKQYVFHTYITENLMPIIMRYIAAQLIECMIHTKNKNIEISSTKQELRSLEGRNSAIRSIFDQQQKAHSNSLEALQQRWNEEREIIVNEVVFKQEEIRQTTAQLQRIDELRNADVKRMLEDVNSLQIEMDRLEQTVSTEMEKRETILLNTNRELLQSERLFHTEEKQIIEGQHKYLDRVMSLERQLGEQRNGHMKECFRFEEQARENMIMLRKQHSEKVNSLKETTKGELRLARDVQLLELQSVENSLLHERQTLQLLEEESPKWNHQSHRITTATRLSTSESKGDDCLVQ